MSATVRLLASREDGIVPGSGATVYCGLTNGKGFHNTAENDAKVTWRTAGRLTNLVARLVAGNRTADHIVVLRNGATDGGGLDIAYTSTPGEFEDASGSNTVVAGDTLSIRLKSGTGGTTDYQFPHVGALWAATNDTTNHVGGVAPGTVINTASATLYQLPNDPTNAVATQADAEWLVKLPGGVDHVTIKNLYVRVSANTSTNGVTFSVNGATGTGTAPSVTIAGSSGAATGEDTTHSIQVKDGDKISIKVVTGAGTVSITPTVVAIEVQSDDGVFHFINGSAGGSAVFTSTNSSSLSGGLENVVAEANVQAKLGVAYVLDTLAVYVKTGGAGTINVRANTANHGPSVSTASSGAWVTDTTHQYAAAASDEVNTKFTRTATPTITCIAIGAHFYQRALTDVAGATDSVARAVVLPRALTDLAGATNSLARALVEARAVTDLAGATNSLARVLVEARSLANVAGAIDSVVAFGDQFGRPTADLAAGSWTVAPLFSKVNEVVRDDANFISSEVLAVAGTTSFADLALTALLDPVTDIDHQLSVAAKATFTLGSLATLKAELRQGTEATSSLIGTLTITPSTSYATYTYTLTTGEADSIVDYTQLFLRLYGVFGVGNLGGIQVSWVQLDVPLRSTIRHGREIFNVAGATDSIARAVVEARALTDLAGATNSLTSARGPQRAVTNLAGATDSVARAVVEARGLTNVAGATDSVARAVVLPRALTDLAGATNALVRSSFVVARAITDVAGALDSIARALVYARALTDVAGATDSVVSTRNTPRALTDVAGATNVLARAVVRVRSLTNVAGATDSLATPAVVPEKTPPAFRRWSGAELLDLPANLGQRIESVRFDILNYDLSYAFTAEQVDRGTPPTMHFDANADTNRTLSGIRFGPVDAARINPLQHLLAPRWSLDDGSLWNMGVLHFANVPLDLYSWGEEFTPDLYDSSLLLNQKRKGSFSIGVGTLLTTAARQVIGEIAGLITRTAIDNSSAYVNQSSPQLFPSGTTRRAILVWICHALGFYPPYFDNDGFLRLRAIPNPISSAEPDVTYTADAASRVVRDTVHAASNINDAPNVYRIIGSPFAGGEVVGEFRVPASAPHSVEHRGFEVVAETQNQNVHDQPAADAAAQAAYVNDFSTYVQVTFDTAPDPRADGMQVVQFLGTNYREQSWDLELRPGGRMTHVVQEIWQP